MIKLWLGEKQLRWKIQGLYYMLGRIYNEGLGVMLIILKGLNGLRKKPQMVMLMHKT